MNIEVTSNTFYKIFTNTKEDFISTEKLENITTKDGSTTDFEIGKNSSFITFHFNTKFNEKRRCKQFSERGY